MALSRAANSDDPVVANAAAASLAGIEQQLKINRGLETLYFGLSLGSVLVLAAIGLAITFGVMGVINMAHGELMMLGAYTTWAVQQLLPGQPGLALILSIPAGFMVAALAGVAIERGVIQFLKGRPLETLLATFGISLILQQLVRTVISPLNRTVITPEWMSGSLVVNDALSLTLNRMYVLGFALVVFAGLMLIMRRTRLGLEVRAVTQNRAMARSMGIRATRVDIMTFALGSGVAGLPGSPSPSSPTSALTWGRTTLSTPSWWWYSAAWATYGARWSLAYRLVLSIRCLSLGRVRYWPKLSCWSLSSYSFKNARVDSSRRRAGLRRAKRCH
ncbi:hypothetical protein HORIV_68030 [Vreelandella olivaria]|uniref:Uncharacterized protein n=1 Tax=Vreelandella olivaria TaxID=390919 RepID=A0ABM7GUA4_9GAMM|nr:hypothetical protein HORIV_68030 [Halomonas olivaria]